MWEPNTDYMSEDELTKLMIIRVTKKVTLGEIGQYCEVKDKGYWSRIIHGKKPVPTHVRAKLNQLFNDFDNGTLELKKVDI